MIQWIILCSFISFCLGHFWGRTENDKIWMRNINYETSMWKYGNFYKVLTDDRYLQLLLAELKIKKLEEE